jgi:uncharacterized membrane protein YciS (DUF1049 family)
MSTAIEKSVAYLLTIVLVFSLVVVSVPNEYENTPQAAFVSAFGDSFVENLDFDLEPIVYFYNALVEAFTESLEAEMEEFEQEMDEYLRQFEYLLEEFVYQMAEVYALLLEFGYTPQNIHRLLTFFPGFAEMEEILTPQVVMDILSMPAMAFVAAIALQHVFSSGEDEPPNLYDLFLLVDIFGENLVTALIGDELPTIELAYALDYFMGEGFSAKLLTMDGYYRFAYIGTAFGTALADLLNEVVPVIIESIETRHQELQELLEMLQEMDYERF